MPSIKELIQAARTPNSPSEMLIDDGEMAKIIGAAPSVLQAEDVQALNGIRDEEVSPLGRRVAIERLPSLRLSDAAEAAGLQVRSFNSAKKVTIGGLEGGRPSYGRLGCRFGADSKFKNLESGTSEKVEYGYIRVHAEPTLEHQSGIRVELSFDKVNVTTMRKEHEVDGKPREAEFYVFEAELDHLQLSSENVSAFVETRDSGGFHTDSQQDDWLGKLSDSVTMNLEPRLHTLTDLNNESFRSTTSYAAFESIVERVVPELFPNGHRPGRQKAAQAKELLFK